MMKENSGRTLTGLNLYLALSKLDLLLAYGERATPLPDAEMTAAIGRFQVATVTDFRSQSAADLHSEIFTARSVGEIVVKVAVEEGECRGAQPLCFERGARIVFALRPEGATRAAPAAQGRLRAFWNVCECLPEI